MLDVFLSALPRSQHWSLLYLSTFSFYFVRPFLRLNKYNCEDHYHLIPTVTVSEVSAKSIFTCFIHFEEQSLKSNMNRSVSYSRINDRVSDCLCICFCHFSSRPNPGPHCLSEQYSRSGLTINIFLYSSNKGHFERTNVLWNSEYSLKS